VLTFNLKISIKCNIGVLNKTGAHNTISLVYGQLRVILWTVFLYLNLHNKKLLKQPAKCS